MNCTITRILVKIIRIFSYLKIQIGKVCSSKQYTYLPHVSLYVFWILHWHRCKTRALTLEKEHRL